jgi:energy-coupling factor transporter ATP-binding protein EcfA2
LIGERVGLGAVLDRHPATLPFADLRRMELAKAIARDPKVVLVDEPFAGLTLGEVENFSALIRSFREEGKAVLLVDHNVKSVAALVDRVLAMYLGERIAEVMTGGDLEPGTAVDEEWMLALERRHFLELLKNAKTQERIAHMLATGKPLRN